MSASPTTVVVLGERDCSLQRRHQKVVEEAPAPAPARGHPYGAPGDAARAAAAAIGYRGAGTVEFLYDAAAGRFFFLEMNTRLQVEHPVTELVHGVDLVAMQLAVAEARSGAEVAARATTSAHDPTGDPRGHAIEVRLYAEDPSDDYRPQSGVLTRFEIPTPEGIRVDAGYATGSTVSTHYDAMLAKVIAHAPTREAAIRLLAGTLARARIHGVVTNRDLLVEVLRSEAFVAGEVSTTPARRRRLRDGRLRRPPRPPESRVGRGPGARSARPGSNARCSKGSRSGGATWSASRTARPSTAT